MGEEKDCVAAFSEEGKWKRKKVRHSASKHTGLKTFCLKELFEKPQETKCWHPVLVPALRERLKCSCTQGFTVAGSGWPPPQPSCLLHRSPTKQSSAGQRSAYSTSVRVPGEGQLELNNELDTISPCT